MKKLLAALAATVLTLSAAFAQNLPAPTIAAKSWLLLDMTSGQTLASQDLGTRVEPASLTKLMTVYLTFAALKEKKLDMNQTVNTSVHAWKVERSSSKMFIEPNKPVKINDLIHGLIVPSGNDAAIALAEAIAGTEDAFVTQMNHEAQRMGMKQTHFMNPHGLPSPENYSTAEDLSILARRLIEDFPEYYPLFAIKSFTYNNISQNTRNRLLWLDPTVDGLKTGHTEGGGYSLIATAKRPNATGDRRLISVVIGAASDQIRAQESLKLLNWGYQNFDTIKLYAKGVPVATPEVWKGSLSNVKIGFTRDIYVTVPKGTAEKMKPVLERKDPLVAPIAEYSPVGVLKMVADGKTIIELPLVALQQVNPASFFGRTWDSIRLWMKK